MRYFNSGFRTRWIFFGAALGLALASILSPAQGGDRDAWQQPDRVAHEMNLGPGMVVADVGCGTGYFSFRLAKAVGEKGIVYATDINERSLSRLRSEIERRNVSGIDVRLSEPTDTKLPRAGVDAVLLCNVLHHVPEANRSEFLLDIARGLRVDGMFYLLEFNENEERPFAKDHDPIPPATLVHLFKNAGMELDAEYHYLPYQRFLRFRKKAPENIWALAKDWSDVHRFSTLFTAQDIGAYLGSEESLEQAIQWCRDTGVTKVFLETFRGNQTANRDQLIRARDRFRAEGFIVHGCITPTQMGKLSTGWNIISCYTNEATRAQSREVFKYAAELFDVIMIDDFLFTDCECDECRAAKGDRSWDDYRLELMARASKEDMIDVAKAANPRAELIIKYPEWYDRFHQRGYGVVRQTDIFDWTWIGTETRDPDSERWGKKPQYGAYWLSQWAKAVSGDKLGGGWFDPYGTSPATYVEQARQTILGQCHESMLFCFNALNRDSGPENVTRFRSEFEGLLHLAEFVRNEPTRGVGTYKIPNSEGQRDFYIFNFLGMLGIPLTAETEFPESAPSLVLTEHAAGDLELDAKLSAVIQADKPVLLTSNLRDRLSDAMKDKLKNPNVSVLDLSPNPPEAETFYGVLNSVRNLAGWKREDLGALRAPLLKALGIEFDAPGNVSIYLYGPDKAVIENFRDEAVEVSLTSNGRPAGMATVALTLGEGETKIVKHDAATIKLAPRALIALEW